MTSRLCRAIAERFADENIEVVIAPAIGSVVLSQWTAHHLSEMNGRAVFGVYALRAERSVLKTSRWPFYIGDSEVTLEPGDELVIKQAYFVIKRGYEKLIADKYVLVVEDVLTTGGSAKKVVEATRAVGGFIVGLGVLWNRGGITP